MVSVGAPIPLVEAIYEVYAADSPGWSELSYRRLAERFAERFRGKRDVFEPAGAEIELRPGQPIAPRWIGEPVRHRMWTADDGEMIQFSPVLCAYNIFQQSYTHFEDHLRDIATFFDAYLPHSHPHKLTAVGQRSVVAVPLEGGHRALRAFHNYPSVAAVVSDLP